MQPRPGPFSPRSAVPGDAYRGGPMAARRAVVSAAVPPFPFPRAPPGVAGTATGSPSQPREIASGWERGGLYGEDSLGRGPAGGLGLSPARGVQLLLPPFPPRLSSGRTPLAGPRSHPDDVLPVHLLI